MFVMAHHHPTPTHRSTCTPQRPPLPAPRSPRRLDFALPVLGFAFACERSHYLYGEITAEGAWFVLACFRDRPWTSCAFILGCIHTIWIFALLMFQLSSIQSGLTTVDYMRGNAMEWNRGWQQNYADFFQVGCFGKAPTKVNWHECYAWPPAGMEAEMESMESLIKGDEMA
jgi:hypothetical protein